MLSGRDIVYISSIEWNFVWQVHQEIALRLAQAGNRVLYIENTGIRSPGLQDAGRVARRLKHWISSLRSRGVRQVAPNIYVCSPFVLPPFGSGWRRQINRHLLLPLVQRAARSLGMRDVLLWTYLPTDTAVDLIRLLRTPRSITVYYCVADFAQLTPSVRQLHQSERVTVELSDLVFTNCSALATHCGQWSNDVHVFPPGVDLDAFPLKETASSHHTINNGGHNAENSSPLSSLQSLSQPIIGYVGGLHRFVDFGLLAAMARSRPQWSWVFVGPLQSAVGELAGLPNVHLLGQQPHSDLAKYIRSFDVCIVPYINSPETATVVPVKINEYLAIGKPVVSTELPTVCDFNERHRILITTPGQAESFLNAIEQALALPNDPATILRRRQVAELSDWEARLASMQELIVDKMQAKTVERKYKVARML